MVKPQNFKSRIMRGILNERNIVFFIYILTDSRIITYTALSNYLSHNIPDKNIDVLESRLILAVHLIFVRHAFIVNRTK